MFCNSDSWDSTICQAEPCSRPLVMEAFYFLYSPFPLFTEGSYLALRPHTFHSSALLASLLLQRGQHVEQVEKG